MKVQYIVLILFVATFSGCKKSVFVSPNGGITTFRDGTSSPFEDNTFYDEYGIAKIK